MPKFSSELRKIDFFTIFLSLPLQSQCFRSQKYCVRPNIAVKNIFVILNVLYNNIFMD